MNSKHKNSTSKNSRNNISKRKGRSAKSSGEEWDNEEEADDEEESWKSNTSPILGNKRPRYVKDCSNRKLKKTSQHSSTDVELKSNKQKSAPNKAHTNTRKAAFSARSQRRAGRSSRGNNYEVWCFFCVCVGNPLDIFYGRALLFTQSGDKSLFNNRITAFFELTNVLFN